MGDSTPTSTVPSLGGSTEKFPRPILKRKSARVNTTLLGSPRCAEPPATQKPKPDMAASFLQYWYVVMNHRPCRDRVTDSHSAMCEKQIMTPLNSILYCSEACRRKDSCKPLSAANITTPSITPPCSEPPSPRTSFTPPVPSRRGTYSYYAESIPAELHDYDSDLDPTEWKPKLFDREDSSDGLRFFSRFHRDRSMTSISETSLRDARREEYSSGASTPTTYIRTPSLRHTPSTTAASSLSTSISVGFTGSFSHYGYDSRSRPLPRQDKWYGLSHSTPKGLDLVTPQIMPASSAPYSALMGLPQLTYGEGRRLSWEKRKVTFAPSSKGDEGLSVLFGKGT